MSALPEKQGTCGHVVSTQTVPFGGLIGITYDGVPVLSNGDELHYSGADSITPSYEPLSSMDKKMLRTTPPVASKLGVKWLCVEFVRRYCAARKGVWMTQIPTAEDLWTVPLPFTRIRDGAAVETVRIANESSEKGPASGDIVVWRRTETLPFGHVAVIVDVLDGRVRVAEQNHGFERWSESCHYSRELEVRVAAGKVEIVDPEDPVLGWISVMEPFYDFADGNIPDDYRIVTGPGSITRQPVEPAPSVPWLTSGGECDCDFFLKRSLIGEPTDDNETPAANIGDVPGAFYYLDYDMWCRINRAANSLHRIAVAATEHVLDDPDSEHLLEYYFGVPPDLQPLLRRSWELTPPMCGRFDFGYDGKRIVMLEYNCDSSGAMLECCDTQEKMAQYYNVTQGKSTGSFLGARCVDYFSKLLTNERVCPRHKLIHFMIDNDDEERYTALCALHFAEKAGFRAKLVVRLDGLFFGDRDSVSTDPLTMCTDYPRIVDVDGEEVLLVWKTWSWDTVFRRYAEQKATASKRTSPSLPDVLLNDHIRVLEPLWKAVTGSKAILPFMDTLAPDHHNMLSANFQRTRQIMSDYHISKPVNGRAGQNVVMYDPVTDKEALRDALDLETKTPLGSPITTMCGSASFGNSAPMGQSVDRGNESSAGRFFDSVLIYQRRVFLKKFDNKYFPIFCGWMIGDQFSGLVVREDTSKITKLASVVIPARVVREAVRPGDTRCPPTEEET